MKKFCEKLVANPLLEYLIIALIAAGSGVVIPLTLLGLIVMILGQWQ